ncbi:MAG: NAD(P)-dependent oxidoreductase [Myxococcales bacterium]|nr:MAG: NAD(P)-dependent oxidoreductase [Myxococcales bacterium]
MTKTPTTALLGLGQMGAALARTLHTRGHRVTAWNRTAARAEPLGREGIPLAASAAEAVAGSPIVLVCLTDHEATRAALEGADLAGKTLVQLSTGSPREAREAEAWARARQADYLDGALLAVPSQIGRPESTLLVSGSSAARDASAPLFDALVGHWMHVGDDAGAASAFDLAVLATLFGSLLGLYHGARLVESERLSVEVLGALLAGAAPAMGQMMQHDTGVIHSGRYAAPESSLETCTLAMELLGRHAREAGIDATFPSFAAALFGRGRAAGLGAESPAALVKVLRASGGRSEVAR